MLRGRQVSVSSKLATSNFLRLVSLFCLESSFCRLSYSICQHLSLLLCFLPASSPSSLPPFPSHHHLLKKFFGGPPSRAHSLDPQVLQATLRASLTFLPLTDALAFVALSECTRHLLSAGPSRFSPLSSAPLLFGQLLRDQVSLTPQAQASPPVVHHRSCRHFALLPASSCKGWFVWLLTTRCPVSTEQGSTVSPALAEDPTPSRRSMYSC